MAKTIKTTADLGVGDVARFEQSGTPFMTVALIERRPTAYDISFEGGGAIISIRPTSRWEVQG